MSVSVQSNAENGFTASLQDFKNAFSLTDKGEFKTSVAKTKGQLYVRDGKICSANIHGGTGAVRSSVENSELRRALFTAFYFAGATQDFLTKAWKQLLPLGDDAINDALSRKDVKDLFFEFERDKPNQQKIVGEKVRQSMTDATKSLTLRDFRSLANGTGDVSDEALKAGADGADYNAALRKALYAVVKNAEVPEGKTQARMDLLGRLARTLIAPKYLEKPLSCDEIRRTLIALDRNTGYVPPKALTDREIHALSATGKKSKLAADCKKIAADAQKIDYFLRCYDGQLSDGASKALHRLSALRHEMAAIGREFLRQKKVDVEFATDRMRRALADFRKANPNTLKWLGVLRELGNKTNKRKGITTEGARYRDDDENRDLLRKIIRTDSSFRDVKDDCRFIGSVSVDGIDCDISDFLRDIKIGLQPLLDLESIGSAYGAPKGKMVPRQATEPIESESSGYISQHLNNGADGNCFFYAVADSLAHLKDADMKSSDLTAADEMRTNLANYIKERLKNCLVKDKDDGKDEFRLYRIGNSVHIPHSFNGSDISIDEFLNPDFSKSYKYIPTAHLAFLADMLKRPIVLLSDVDKGGGEVASSMLCYNRDLANGAVIEGEPICLHFSGSPSKANSKAQGSGHYQAVSLNQDGMEKLKVITSYFLELYNDLPEDDAEVKADARDRVDNELKNIENPAVEKEVRKKDADVDEEADKVVEAAELPKSAARPKSPVAVPSVRQLADATNKAEKAGCAFTIQTKSTLESRRAAAQQAMDALRQFSAEALAIAWRTDSRRKSPAGKAIAAAQGALQAFNRALAEVTTRESPKVKLSADARATRDIAFGELQHQVSQTVSGLDRYLSRLADTYVRDGGYGLSDPIDLAQIGTDAFDEQEVAQTLENYKAKIDEVCDTVVNSVFGADKGKVSDSTKHLIKNVLLHGARGAILEKGSKADLEGKGSVAHSLTLLARQNDGVQCRLSTKVLTLALALPPEQVPAYLRACALLPVNDGYGLFSRIFAVADRLVRLPPEMLTPLNVIQLACPEANLSVDCPGFMSPEPAPLDDKLLDCLMAPGNDLVFHKLLNAGKNELGEKLVALLGKGGSLADIHAVYDKEKPFSLTMVPQSMYFPDIEGLQALEGDVKKNFNFDADRNHPRITIDAGGNTKEFDFQGQALDALEASKREEFFTEIGNLCGAENDVQQRAVLCFISQRSADVETILYVARGKKEEPALNEQFVLKKDPTTGDVIATKKTTPDKDYGMEVTLRIGKDGSMSLVRAEEQPFRRTSKLVAPTVDSAMVTLRSILKDFGFNDADEREAKMDEFGRAYVEKMDGVFKELANGTLQLEDAIERERKAFDDLFDRILPEKDFSHALKNPGKETVSAKVKIVNRIAMAKTARPATILIEMARLSDEGRKVAAPGEIPPQDDPHLEILRQSVFRHVVGIVKDLEHRSFEHILKICQDHGTLDPYRIADGLFKKISAHAMTQKYLKKPLYAPTSNHNLPTLSPAVEYMKALNDVFNRNHEDGQRPDSIMHTFSREFGPVLSDKSVVLTDEEGVSVNLADPLEKKPKISDDNRLRSQKQPCDEGNVAAMNFLRFFDKHVLPKMNGQDNAYNEILLLVSSTFCNATGIPSFVGEIFDIGLGIRKKEGDNELGKDTANGLQSYCDVHGTSTVIRLTKDGNGEPQLVLELTQPHGMLLNGEVVPDEAQDDPQRGKLVSYKNPFFIHQADVKVTMKIPLLQKQPQPGDPPVYDLDLKFEPFVPS